MGLTSRQIWICLGLGLLLALPQFAKAQGDIPYMIGQVLGTALVLMLICLIWNFVTRKKDKTK